MALPRRMLKLFHCVYQDNLDNNALETLFNGVLNQYFQSGIQTFEWLMLMHFSWLQQFTTSNDQQHCHCYNRYIITSEQSYATNSSILSLCIRGVGYCTSMSRIMSGCSLYETVNNDLILIVIALQDSNDFIQLWYHEVRRVFTDRFTTQDHRYDY